MEFQESVGFKLLLRAEFLIALAATMGSLWFSEVLDYPPCALCWYQRIFMYPLLVIFSIALWTSDRSYSKFSTPLSILGLALAVYHNFVYYGLIPERIVPCEQGISCSAIQIRIFGFITIPLMSAICFGALSALGIVSLSTGVGSEGEKEKDS